MSRTLAATTRIDPPEGWTVAQKAEFETGQFNGCVGSRLLSESGWARVWEVRLKPGERLPFHRHLLDYFWTTVNDCEGLSHYHDGRVVRPVYKAGDTSFMSFAQGEFMVHDIQNTGTTDFIFITVELLNSANAPIAVPDTIRRATAA